MLVLKMDATRGSLVLTARQAGFFILEHPSDLGIEAHAERLPGAFEQAAIGLMSVILDLSSVEGLIHKPIEIQAFDTERLLVKWLNEVLFLYDGEGFVSSRFKVEELRKDYLRATVTGEPLCLEKHRLRLDVKAITYHQLCVMEAADEARVRVFLDI